MGEFLYLYGGVGLCCAGRTCGILALNHGWSTRPLVALGLGLVLLWPLLAIVMIVPAVAYVAGGVRDIISGRVR